MPTLWGMDPIEILSVSAVWAALLIVGIVVALVSPDEGQAHTLHE